MCSSQALLACSASVVTSTLLADSISLSGNCTPLWFSLLKAVVAKDLVLFTTEVVAVAAAVVDLWLHRWNWLLLSNLARWVVAPVPLLWLPMPVGLLDKLVSELTTNLAWWGLGCLLWFLKWNYFHHLNLIKRLKKCSGITYSWLIKWTRFPCWLRLRHLLISGRPFKAAAFQHNKWQFNPTVECHLRKPRGWLARQKSLVFDANDTQIQATACSQRCWWWRSSTTTTLPSPYGTSWDRVASTSCLLATTQRPSPTRTCVPVLCWVC